MARFVGVAHRTQVLAARDAGIVQFSHGSEAAVRALEPGDTVIYYAPKSDAGGSPVQAFIAHATVTGAECYRKAWRADFTAWVRDADYAEVSEVPVRPLLGKLDFVPDSRNWGLRFRSGKFEIGEADYQRLAGALLGGAP